MIEVFKDIKNFENYQVSNLGRVYSKNKNCFMSLKHKAGRGYIQVNLWDGKKHVHKYLHRLIAEVFIDNPNNYRTVNHIDGNKLNNVVTNLEWADDEKQQRHAFFMGLKHNGIALSDEDVFKVYDMYFKQGIYPKKISEILNKPFGTIRKICYGERCKSLLREYREKYNV